MNKSVRAGRVSGFWNYGTVRNTDGFVCGPNGVQSLTVQDLSCIVDMSLVSHRHFALVATES
jgi:hypothetical protein